MDPETEKQVMDLLQQDLDWHYLIKTADQHRVLPLIYMSFAYHFSKAVPKDVLDHLRIWFHTNAIKNKIRTQELLRLLKLFKILNIPVIPFKGPTLAISIYSNLALHQFNDLDILVYESDYCHAQELLIKQGYRKIKDFGYESTFQEDSDGTQIDLHQKIDPSRLNSSHYFKHLLNRLEQISAIGEKLPKLSSEDTLIILCVNFVKDWFLNKNKLSQICNIAELLQIHRNMNWSIVIAQAKDNRVQRILFLCLLLVNKIRGISLPKEVLQEINKARPLLRTLVSEVHANLFCLINSQSQCYDRPGVSLALKIMLADRLRDRIHIYLYNKYSYHVIKNKIKRIGKHGLRLFSVLTKTLFWDFAWVKVIRTYSK